MIPYLFFLLLPLSAFSQADMYQAKPWVPKNISPGVAEFVSMPAPKRGRSYPPPPAPVYTPHIRVPKYVENSGYIRHLKDQQTSESNGKPMRVARPPVTSRNFATQLTPPRPRQPPPSAKLYRGMISRNDVVLSDGVDQSENEIEDASTLVNFGDWAAQWDEDEEAWYFYNYMSGASTWDKPEELADLRFENPFGSTDGEDSAQIPSPLTAEVPGSQTPTSNTLLVPSGTPPVPLPKGDPYANVYLDGNDDGYNDDYNDVERDSSSSTDEPAPTGIGAIFGGLSSIKKSLGINDILGIKLKSGGSIKKAISKNLSEASLYKNVASDFVQTFLIKVTGWAVISMFLYGNNIFNAKRKRRSTDGKGVTPAEYLTEIQSQIERSIAHDFTNMIKKIKL